MIENVLAMALLVTVFFMIIDGSIQLFKTDGETGRTQAEYQIVSQIIETIKGEPAIYQKNFNPASGNASTYLSNFPFGFGGNILYTGNPPKCDPADPTANAVPGSGSELPTESYCDGMVAYTIQPSLSYTGFFEGTVRVIHLSKDPKVILPDNYYYFLLNTN